MRLAMRLKAVESKLCPEDKDPRLVIVLEDEDGTWRDWQGNAVVRAGIGPWVRVIRLVRCVRHAAPGGSPVGPFT